MNDLYKEFGRLLRAARTDAKLTQDQVAGRVGLSRTSITNIERGSQHIALHQLFLLASALGVPPAALLPDARAVHDDLFTRSALEALRASADDEGMAFAAKILSKHQPTRRLERKRAEA